MVIGISVGAHAGGLADNVDPFIGVDWYGEVFPGAVVPFGMVKLGPDMVDIDGKPGKSGYVSNGQVLGFSHLHLSGAAGKYGNILVSPVTGPLDPDDIRSPRDHESAAPGYFTTHLLRYATKVELTASRRVGFHRYVFEHGGPSHVTFDLDHCLTKGAGAESQKFLGGRIDIVCNHEIQGVGRYAGGWNEGGEYKVYFYAVADHPSDSTHVWSGGAPTTDRTIGATTDVPLGASLDYALRPGSAVQLKVGISFVSIEQARRNVESEIPAWDFDAVRHHDDRLWSDRLSVIRIDGATPSKRRQFFTALYHTMLMPVDRSGEDPAELGSKTPYYDDFYTLWDLYRTSFPLLELIETDRARDMIRSLMEIYRHEGYLPDGHSGNVTGRTQSGSNADVVIADAYVKGLGGIDYAQAYQAMRKDADVPPADPRKEGRGGLADFRDKGYVAQPTERAGSRTLDYSYDDFAISEVACGLGHPDEAAHYRARADNWTNLWDPTLTQFGVAGFIRPRNADRSWAAPDLQKRGTWPDFFYEDDLWTYSLSAPQDVRRLIALSGGNAGFVDRLDVMFKHFLFDMTNEPGFLIPMLYIWAGRPDRTADRVTEYLEKWFEDSRGGLPGNDDSGAMSSWFVFQSLGIYPLAGQDVYLIGTPSFDKATLRLSAGKILTISAENLDGHGINRYVQSARLNGKDLPNAWFRHREIAQGGTLNLVMGSMPSNWGRTTPPPSLSDPDRASCQTTPSVPHDRSHS